MNKEAIQVIVKPQHKFYSWKEAFEEVQQNTPDYFELDGSEEENYLNHIKE